MPPLQEAAGWVLPCHGFDPLGDSLGISQPLIRPGEMIGMPHPGAGVFLEAERPHRSGRCAYSEQSFGSAPREQTECQRQKERPSQVEK